jgi:BirA family biotin operon repressor/biotin-[acetyl-CoA-carboxylase] ligase
MVTRRALLELLADGAFHSGRELGAALGVTRAAVCKHVHALAAAGVEVHRVSGRGYRLTAPLALLDAGRIGAHLGAGAAPERAPLVLDEVDSTNRHLVALAAAGREVDGLACLAEAQPAGRGRRGRHWVATPYRDLMLSMAWRFQSGPALVAGLSLAAGVAVLRALEAEGVSGVGLKWPNDLLWEGRKLAGLLADVQGEAAGPCLVVLGVGINVEIGAREAARIDQPWADLRAVTGAVPDRNRLAAGVIRELRRMFRAFAAEGLAAFRAEWEARHLYHGRAVRLLLADGEARGTVAGIDDSGALRVRDARGHERRFHSGEISVRGA